MPIDQNGALLHSKLLSRTPPVNSKWNHGGMPVLFPFAGRSPGPPGRCVVPGFDGSMEKHGFAHAAQWRGDNRKRVLDFGDSWPWQGVLTHKVQESPFEVTGNVIVENKSEVALPHNLGLHPYFLVKVRDLMGARIEADFSALYRVNDESLAESSCSLDSFDWSLKNPVFANGIFAINGGGVKLIRGAQVLIHVRAPEARYFVFWSTGSGFVCIEPWCELPGQYRYLARNSKFNFPYQISFSDCF